MNSSQKPEDAFARLTAIVNTLMSEGGCAWDLVQTRESLKPFLVEETYETLEALDSNQPEKIVDEMGDLLYQILFHSKISETRGEFNITDVLENLTEKMVRRHPHVFKSSNADTPDKVLHQWEEIKKQEKGNRDQKSALDNIPKALPGLARAQKLQKKAAKQGFDWDKIEDVFAKLDEEVEEFKEAFRENDTPHMSEEMGDLLFVMVNIARFKKIDAEEALRCTNNKFIHRFQHIEQEVARRGKTLRETSLEKMEQYWQDAKKLRPKETE